MHPILRQGLASLAILASLALSGAHAQAQVFTGLTDQGQFIYVEVAPATPDSAGYGFISLDYAMRCSGGKVRYRGGAFSGNAGPDATGKVPLGQWDRDTRMTGQILVAPDGQTVTGSFTIAQPMIRDVGRTSEFISRCTSGPVSFTAQADPPAAPASR